MPTCWMCSKNEATTGEHIFKHSILRYMFGDKPFEVGNRLISHTQKEYNGRTVTSKKYIQSTDSDEFKFLKSLCGDCNGSKSQDWDTECDRFFRHILSCWKITLNNGFINLKDCHPKCTKKDARKLYNYFCKLFGCLLFSKGQPVPPDIIDIVNGYNYQNSLGVNVVFDVDLEFIEDHRSYLVGHDLTGDYIDGKDMNVTKNCRWALGIGPIKIAFWYKTPPIFVIGEPWYGKSKRIDFSKNV